MARRKQRHSLTLVRRDSRLRPWLPSCPCGWIGIPGRRVQVEEQYREHREERPVVTPRPLTPEVDVPELLRLLQS